MIYVVDNSHHVTRWQPPVHTGRWKRVGLHTTEGESTSGDLSILQGNDQTHPVSIGDYLARPDSTGRIVDYTIVDAGHVAYHMGYMWIGGQWVGGGNNDTYGIEIGHKKGQKWNAYHLAAAFDLTRTRVAQLGVVELCRHMDYAANRPESLGGPRSDPTDFPFWSDFQSLAFKPAYALLGPPDVAVDVYDRRLSPILGAQTARDAYALVVRYGLRTGPMLALIGQESTFGTTDNGRKNWGNVRQALDPNTQIGTEGHGLAVFSNWLDSLDDACKRTVETERYIKAGAADVVTWRTIWAPVGDGVNNPFHDATRMLGWIDEWRNVPMATDYAALWGTIGEAPYIPEWGIAQWFRAEVDAGRSPGRCLAPERVLPDGTTRQDFEKAVAIYRPGQGTVAWRRA